ncbi:MAG: 5-(carboxyamino)imidazole ribonucleotide synthase [Spirochaetaceae bacterium]
MPTLLVLGGGQLARMMLPAARRLDITLAVLDPHPRCPACAGADRAITGDFADYETVLRAAETIEPDVATIEIEHVSIDAMAELARRGVPVFPGAETVATINDKLRQRRRLAEAGLPMPRFLAAPNEDDLATSGPHHSVGDDGKLSEAIRELGLPAVQKLRFGGYDGRGVAVVREAGDKLPLRGPSMLEEHAPIAAELAVLVARRRSGDTAVYEPFEMEMDQELNLLRSVFYPASPDTAVCRRAKEVAVAAAEALSIVGVSAVELFLTTDGDVLVNEVAPRPHNSAHLTMEAAETDQFEQHLRAIFDLPLGSAAMRGPAVMRNLVASGKSGPTRYVGLEQALAIPGVHPHLYGKRESRPGRKMGHITVFADTLDIARQRAGEAAAVLRVEGPSPDE